MSIKFQKAKINNLKAIISLLTQDDFGKDREHVSDKLDQRYIDAFHKINNDSNQYLMVACEGESVVGTCHLTLLPSLTFIGSMRMQIEAVRVKPNFRGKNIGYQMIEFAINWGGSHGATIFQLSTNKQRPDALRFYKKLGFESTHEGMKLYLSNDSCV